MKISASTGKRNKIHVSIDGEYAYTVDAEYWYSCPYRDKSEIEGPEEIERFKHDVGSRSAFISGLNILSYGDNSRKALGRKLVSKGFCKEYVEAALDRLEEYGYVNDERYAQNLAQKLLDSKHMSPGAIKQELMLKGVDRETADAAAGELETDPHEQIMTLLCGKYSRYLHDEKGIKKTVAALKRLGYGWSDIKNALEEAQADTEDEFID